MISATENKMAVTQLTDEILISKIKHLASIERKLTQVMILHIAEMDRRKLYLRLAYSSLYDYLTKEIGYSEGAAQRRIDAARLFHSVPEIAQKIESGAVKLSQISHVQKMCRQIKKDSGKTISAQARQNILEKIENQSAGATQIIVAEALNIKPNKEEIIRKTFQADESVRVELTFSKEEFDLIKQAQASLSNKTGGGLKDTILELAQTLIKKEQMKVIPNIDGNLEGPIMATGILNTSHITPKNDCEKDFSRGYLKDSTATVAVPLKTKKAVRLRDQCCQFKDNSTGKICGSNYFLEVDHIQPRFAEGDNNFDNLRLLCRNHNQFRYQARL